MTAGRRDAFLISCEHGGKRIPARWRPLFEDHVALLDSHRGHDPGALCMARELAAALDAPLFAATVSRLLIELNRSPGHPRLYSEITRGLPRAARQELFERHYLPYRNAVEACVAALAAQGKRAIHVSSHSFTPEIHGAVRNADIGLLYDPARPGESALCRRWRQALQDIAPGLKVRMNYPYAGTDDGFTTFLRRRFPADRYVGIELEINQKHALAGGRHWRAVRTAVIAGLRRAAGIVEPVRLDLL